MSVALDNVTLGQPESPRAIRQSTQPASTVGIPGHQSAMPFASGLRALPTQFPRNQLLTLPPYAIESCLHLCRARTRPTSSGGAS